MTFRTTFCAFFVVAGMSCSSLGGPDDALWASYTNLVGQPVEVSFGLLHPPTSVLYAETVCGTLTEHTDSHIVLGPVAGEARCETIIPAFITSRYLTLTSFDPPRVLVRRGQVGSLNAHASLSPRP